VAPDTPANARAHETNADDLEKASQESSAYGMITETAETITANSGLSATTATAAR
jgi:hypothetical protein